MWGYIYFVYVLNRLCDLKKNNCFQSNCNLGMNLYVCFTFDSGIVIWVRIAMFVFHLVSQVKPYSLNILFVNNVFKTIVKPLK